jgi:hypothetical protein
MYANIKNKTYTKLRDLSFSPQADITGAEVVINQLVVTIKTEDTIEIGQELTLYDDRDNIWAKYWITDADKYDEYSWKVVAKSYILLLDRRKMPAKMYAGESAAAAISEIMGSVPYRVDASVSGTITGFAPEQSARERLQWVCFCLGAYVKSFFNDRVEILDVGEDLRVVPLNKTFWKPSVSYDDYVTAIRLRLYTYRQGTPETTDQYVKVESGGQEVYYIETTQDVTINNPNVPASVPENIIEFNDVKLVNSGNASEIASRLSTYYFMRMEVDADIINNAEYKPAERLAVYLNANTLVEGYMKTADFSFGTQAKSKIKLAQSRAIDAVRAVIRYLWGADLILSQTYYLPKQYGFTIQTQYIEKYTDDGHRYVFYPLTDEASGSTGDEGTTVDIQNLPALDLYDRALMLYNVDDVDGGEVVKIG